mmetsp:Transcript_88617/g.231302  ORF Transcript_88617/g.231302 Transcript_88617/m.231302 type:complete len:251 (-) Transcript_88617:3-755(-)
MVPDEFQAVGAKGLVPLALHKHALGPLHVRPARLEACVVPPAREEVVRRQNGQQTVGHTHKEGEKAHEDPEQGPLLASNFADAIRPRLVLKKRRLHSSSVPVYVPQQTSLRSTRSLITHGGGLKGHVGRPGRSLWSRRTLRRSRRGFLGGSLRASCNATYIRAYPDRFRGPQLEGSQGAIPTLNPIGKTFIVELQVCGKVPVQIVEVRGRSSNRKAESCHECTPPQQHPAMCFEGNHCNRKRGKLRVCSS